MNGLLIRLMEILHLREHKSQIPEECTQAIKSFDRLNGELDEILNTLQERKAKSKNGYDHEH